MTEHGKRSTYINNGCRCEPCKTANVEYDFARGETCADCGNPCSPTSKRCKPCYLALATRPREDPGIPLTQFPGGTGDSVVTQEEFFQPEFESSESVFRGLTGPMREGNKFSSWSVQ